ncbi:MAG TPA: hypothetical protein VH044_10985 [Polyangiaceae bacterium]|nr:hypothetical protein [Polyangiaceae bacterium]
MSAEQNRLGQIAGAQAMVTGVQKHLATLPSFSVGSQMLTPGDIVKIYQDRAAIAQAAEAAHAATTAAVKMERDKRAQTASVTRAFRRIVQGMFAESPDTLADFGLKPLKVGTKTVATKSGAIAKTKATRVARHTLGSKQKEKIKGTVSPTAPEVPPTAPTPVTPPTGNAPAGGVTAPPTGNVPAGGVTTHTGSSSL